LVQLHLRRASRNQGLLEDHEEWENHQQKVQLACQKNVGEIESICAMKEAEGSRCLAKGVPGDLFKMTM